jgi:hypothetical protein
MQQQFFQVFRYAFYLYKGVILIVFTIALGIDLSHVHSLIETGIVLAAVLAALAFFDPIVDILLLVSLIALVVLVAHGYCSNPTIESGVRACVTTAWELAFNAITDLIHRLLALLAPHPRPEIIEWTSLRWPFPAQSHLLTLPTPTTWS